MAYRALPWNEGEEKMHRLTRVPQNDNPMNPTLTPRAGHQISIYSLMAAGTTDQQNRPWTTLWGGKPPLAQQIAPGGIIGIRATVDGKFDPVASTLLGGANADGEPKQLEQGAKGAMVSALSIGLEQRGRVKLYGRMMAGAMSSNEDKHDDASQPREDREKDDMVGHAASIQLVLKIEQSLGNCPKYLNKKVITTHTDLKPRLVSTDIDLPQEALDLIASADLFFVSSSHKYEDMDTNHRGGSPGFIRVQRPATKTDTKDENTGTVLIWPEYSGNNLYQTLGNLMSTPLAGLCIPDFETGNVLYLTGTTEVLINESANSVLPKSKLAVRFTTTGARFVTDGLGFRGKPVEDSAQGRSPYNPRIRYLKNERKPEFAKDYSGNSDVHSHGADAEVTAKLIKKTKLTPTITKYRFSLSDPTVLGPQRPGQYVALDFSEELNMGYSHMRDDDPRSLNDDFLRTFTVSSPPGKLGIHGEEFEMIIRKVGTVTEWLSWQRDGATQLGVRGFGGEFSFDAHLHETSKDDGKQGGKTVFIAAGIGITPLLSQIGTIPRLKIVWTISVKDIGLVLDVVKVCSDDIRRDMVIYLTGVGEKELSDDQKSQLAQLETDHPTVQVEKRRMTREDLKSLADIIEEDRKVENWYLCTAPEMRKTIQEWLPGTSIVFENFDY